MKHKLFCTLGFMVVAVMGFAANPSGAATAAGPYYATPSWDQTLPASTRFIDLTNMPGAVLDRETGLVWEKVPSTFGSWGNASIHCVQLNLGGRKGWRLPTIQDLASLIDPNQSNPALPSGHPFTVLSSFFWSATSSAPGTTGAWGVNFSNGDVLNIFDKAADILRTWCVRGGQGVDPQ
jgi:hypothetical protein